MVRVRAGARVAMIVAAQLGYTALHHAIANSAYDCVQRLINIRADVTNRDGLVCFSLTGIRC